MCLCWHDLQHAIISMQKIKVLLIEDEPAIADTVTYALGTEGYEAIWCDTGQAGLLILASESPQLVILDIGLPDVDGFTVCREIRQFSDVPIIILTARSDEVDRIVGLELGADDYVTKPFSPRELTARVKANLRRMSKANTQPGFHEKDAFDIDADACEVRYRGSALGLSRYEYRLLKVLLTRPGRVYSREQLMDLVWEEPEHSMDRTVDTHIKTLRAKICAAGGRKEYIKTHRGMGYAFNPTP